MQGQSLFFTTEKTIEIREMEVQPPASGELVVETLVSAISPGTELMIYRGQAPTEMSVDENIAALGGSLAFPLNYGYAAVGTVIEIGEAVDANWIGKTVFSFQPHQTHFTASTEQVMELPKGISPSMGAFLPNMETAVNLVMDGAPLIGERVAVFGQGIIGLLATSLLSQFPLDQLITLDLYPNRRSASLKAGASHSFDPSNPELISTVIGDRGIDLAFELSGSPTALNQAIHFTGFNGRIVIGSWYGKKQAEIDLGSSFHRSRIQLVSSQVSSIRPELTGRWDKARRFYLSWEMIRHVHPEQWITHTLPFEKARQGYQLLDEHPEEVIQVLLSYP